MNTICRKCKHPRISLQVDRVSYRRLDADVAPLGRADMTLRRAITVLQEPAMEGEVTSQLGRHQMTGIGIDIHGAHLHTRGTCIRMIISNLGMRTWSVLARTGLGVCFFLSNMGVPAALPTHITRQRPRVKPASRSGNPTFTKNISIFKISIYIAR